MPASGRTSGDSIYYSTLFVCHCVVTLLLLLLCWLL
jgi:hypothetical protein